MSKKYIYSPIIYKTTNLVTGLIYVGQHYTSANDGYLGSGTYFKSILKEFGEENFIRETLEYSTKQDLNNKEIYWVKKFRSNDPAIGYNKSVGGQLGWYGKDNPMFGKHHSEESNRKNRENQPDVSGEKNPFYGKKHSDETKRKMSKPRDENFKNKIKETHANVSGENNPRNLYYFKCSQNKDYWKDFTKNERIGINAKFRKYKKDIILYKEIIIKRIEKEFLYGKMD